MGNYDYFTKPEDSDDEDNDNDDTEPDFDSTDTDSEQNLAATVSFPVTQIAVIDLSFLSRGHMNFSQVAFQDLSSRHSDSQNARGFPVQSTRMCKGSPRW